MYRTEEFAESADLALIVAVCCFFIRAAIQNGRDFNPANMCCTIFSTDKDFWQFLKFLKEDFGIGGTFLFTDPSKSDPNHEENPSGPVDCMDAIVDATIRLHAYIPKITYVGDWPRTDVPNTEFDNNFIDVVAAQRRKRQREEYEQHQAARDAERPTKRTKRDQEPTERQRRHSRSPSVHLRAGASFCMGKVVTRSRSSAQVVRRSPRRRA